MTGKSLLKQVSYQLSYRQVPEKKGVLVTVTAWLVKSSFMFVGTAFLSDFDLMMDKGHASTAWRSAYQTAYLNALLQVRVHVERVIAAFLEYKEKYKEQLALLPLDPPFGSIKDLQNVAARSQPLTTTNSLIKFSKEKLESRLKNTCPIKWMEPCRIDICTTYTYALPFLFYLRFGRDYCGTVKAKSRVEARGEIKALLRRCGHVLDHLPKEIVIK